MKIFVIIISSIFLLTTCTQNQKNKNGEKFCKTYDFSNVTFWGVEVMPVFQNGLEDLIHYTLKNIDYPKLAITDSIEGLIWMELTIGKDGAIESAKALHGIRKDIDEECIKAFQKMPNWTPGKQKNMSVKVDYHVQINFLLKPDDKKSGIIITPGKKYFKESQGIPIENPCREKYSENIKHH